MLIKGECASKELRSAMLMIVLRLGSALTFALVRLAEFNSAKFRSGTGFTSVLMPSAHQRSKTNIARFIDQAQGSKGS